jgi:probable HAF family extracellular repeat protein
MVMSDLNERNEMAGTYTPEGLNRPILRRDGRIVVLPDLVRGGRADYAEALALNDRTEVVGVSQSSEFPQQLRAFLWRDGRIRDIGALAGLDAVFPQSINNRGQIAGTAFQAGDTRAFFWENGRMRLLPGLLDPADFTAAADLNEGGEVAGSSQSAAGFRGVLWRDGRVFDLGTLPGSSQSTAQAITNRRQVLMQSGFEGDAPRTRAWIWDRGQQRVLPMLHPDDVSNVVANAINELDQVVGYQDIFVPPPEAPQVVPLLWDGDNVYDLHDLIDEDDPLRPFVTLIIPGVINDRGVILAIGNDSRQPGSAQFILTPVQD